ncbi:MAG: sigma-E processing peptidase SpoIIGA, partial [Oscillospiraceae bacterium]|nr:sigma-E processing peptidase SpoIIGA [Oscillospiraceae bacterium]
LGSRRVTLRVLRDTGNGLTDPLGGERVLIADAAALAPLLGTVSAPPCADAAALFRRLSEDPALSGRLRLLPYAAVGTAEGLLVCFRPDRALIGGEPRRLLAGISPTPIRGGYDAIF